MRDIKCAICGDAKYRILYPQRFTPQSLNGDTYSARRTPVLEHYQMVRCLSCDMVFSTPILEISEITGLYERSKFNYGSLVEDLQNTYGRYLALLTPPDKQRLLEIGCGNGFFLERAKQQGYKEVFGVEPGVEAIRKASIDIPIVRGMFESGQFPQDFFDVITFFQTLDHIIDPNIFLQACRQCLRPNGEILCITHNIDALAAKILGEHCPMVDIEHIFLFNKQTLGKIFARNDFSVVDVFDIANTFPLSYYLHLMPLLRNIRLPGFIGDKRLTMKVGNIGIIARKVG